MDENLIKAQDICLENINHICRDFGLNNVMAQLYVTLYFSYQPLSLDEMSERLKISKGSVSVNIRGLERYGVVKRIWVKGSRKDYYEAEANIAKVILDRATSMAARRMGEIEKMMNLANAFIVKSQPSTEEDKKAVVVFKERLDELKDIHGKLTSMLQLFNASFAGISFFEKNPKKEVPDIN